MRNQCTNIRLPNINLLQIRIMKLKSPLALQTLIGCTIAVCLTPSSHATNGAWISGGSSELWSDTSNWAAGTPAGGAGAAASFEGTGVNTVRLDAPVTLGTLHFASTTDAANWTLSSQTSTTHGITLSRTGGSPAIEVASNTQAEIAVALSGIAGFSKTGAGALILSAANPLVGTVAVADGTLALSGLGQVDNVHLSNASSTFDLSAISANHLSLTSVSGVQGSSLVLGSRTLEIANSNVYSSSTFAGNLSGAQGSLVKSGAGTLSLEGVNSYTGTTTVNAGTLDLKSRAALYDGQQDQWTKENITVKSGAALHLSAGGATGFTEQDVGNLMGELTQEVAGNGLQAGSAIGIDTTQVAGGVFTVAANIGDSAGDGGGSVGLNKLGANTLLLTGQNSYSGTTNLQGGTLKLTGTGNVSLSHLSSASGTTLNLADAEGTIDIRSVSAVGDIQLGNRSVTLGAGNGNSSISGNVSGTNATLAKVGSSVLTLSGNNAYTGETTVESGTLKIDTYRSWNDPYYSPLGSEGPGNGTTVQNGATLELRTFIRGESLTISGDGSGSGALVGNLYRAIDPWRTPEWGGDVTLAADAKIGARVSGDLMLAGNTLTLGNSVISGNITGTGNVLVDDNAYFSGIAGHSGSTRVLSEGTLSVGPTSMSSWTQENVTIESNGTLSLRLGGVSAFNTADAASVIQGLSINLNQNGFKAGSTIGFDTDDSNDPYTYYHWIRTPNPITYSHAIGDSTGDGGGSLGLVKQGKGALILAGANSYTGQTDVLRGQLVFSGAATLYGGDQTSWTKEKISVHAGGALVLGVGGTSGFTSSQVANIFSGLSSSISQNGLMSGSAFGIDTSAATGTVTYSAAITDSTGDGAGAVGFTKMGNGRLILSGNNSYSGDTNILGGTLELGSNQALGQSTDVFLVGNGSKLNLGGRTVTLDNLILDGDLSTVTSVADVISVSNGTIVLAEGATADVTDAVISANLTGAGNVYLGSYSNSWYSNVYDAGIRGAYISGINSYTGTTTIGGSAYFTRPEALYAGDSSKWNSNFISVGANYFSRGGVQSGELGLSMGPGGFSGEQASALLNGLRQRADDYEVGGFGLEDGSGLLLDVEGQETLTIGSSEMDTEYESGILLTKRGSGTLTLNTSDSLKSDFRIYEGKLILGNTIGNNSGAHGYWDVSSNVDLNGNNLHAIEFEGPAVSSTEQGPVYGVNNSQVGTVSTISLHGSSEYLTYSEIHAGGKLDDFGNLVRGDVAVEKVGSSTVNFEGSGLSRITVKAGVLEISGASAETLSIDGGNAVISGGFSGGFYGNAVINSGQLIVGSTGGLQPGSYGDQVVSGHVLVRNGGTLGGHGSVAIHSYYTTSYSGIEAVNVEAGGRIAPGTSIGSLQTYGGVTLASNSTYQYEVDSSAALAAAADLLVTQGDLNLNMTQLAFGNVAEVPEAFEVGTLFSLLNYTGTWNGGLFVLGSNILENGEEFFAGQNYWSIDYDAEIGGLNFSEDQLVSSSSRFINITATAVPEPSSILLGAAASLLLLRRKR